MNESVSRVRLRPGTLYYSCHYVHVDVDNLPYLSEHVITVIDEFFTGGDAYGIVYAKKSIGGRIWTWL